MQVSNAIVTNISRKLVKTKNGPRDTYYFTTTDGQYCTNFKDHGLSVGDVVSFSYVQSKWGMDVDPEDIVKHKPDSPVALPRTAPANAVPRNPKDVAYGSGGSNKGVFPIPPTDGQRSILRQNALTNARELVVATHGGKPFVWSSDIADEIIAVARKFEAYTSGDQEVEAALKEAAGEAVQTGNEKKAA